MWPFKREPKGSSCYFLVLHFTSAEEAAVYASSLPGGDVRAGARMLRGGETIPVCPTPEEA